jgi:hypothetical protein
MSRRRKHRNTSYDTFSAWWPEPPHRTVFKSSPSPHYERRHTEVHRAFTSFGRDNDTHRLSDGEFGSQVVEEIGYLACVGGACFRRGLGTLVDLLEQIF